MQTSVKSKRFVSMSSVVTPEKKLSARNEGLALMLDEGTRKSHSIAENTQFVTGFFKGLSNKKSFSSLVASLYFVYEAMEGEFNNCDDPRVKSMNYKELLRVDELEKDMLFYFGSTWRDDVSMSPATIKYIKHIRKVAKVSPYLLVAHQYTRYLGDLFGGQMMGGMASRSLKLEENQGIAFYTFSDIPNNKAFIEDWYATLNSLEFSEEEKSAIVDEGNIVFRLNIELFDELEGSGVAAAMKLLFSSIKSKFKSMFA